MILLARFDRKHVPGLLWGGASVSTVIALISLDMSCGQVLFGPFNALMNALGTDYTGALQESIAARVGGLYSDANVTACLFSLALFMALYLLKNSTCIWRRLAASLLAGVNAVSLLLTGSRGAVHPQKGGAGICGRTLRCARGRLRRCVSPYRPLHL